MACETIRRRRTRSANKTPHDGAPGMSRQQQDTELLEEKSRPARDIPRSVQGFVLIAKNLCVAWDNSEC